MLGGHCPGTLYKSPHVILTAVVMITILSTENHIGWTAKSACWASLNQLCREPGFAQAIHSFPHNLDGKWFKKKPGCGLVQAVAVQVSGHLSAFYVLRHISLFPYKLIYKLWTDDQLSLWYCSVRISRRNRNTSSSNSLDVLITRFQMLILL